MTAPERKSPARWRAARFPEAGGRWDTPMNRSVWFRDKGRDVELWRGPVHLATVKTAAKLAATKEETP